jgi:hypothetical protein
MVARLAVVLNLELLPALLGVTATLPADAGPVLLAGHTPAEPSPTPVRPVTTGKTKGDLA